jgi:hypothetical protein
MRLDEEEVNLYASPPTRVDGAKFRMVLSLWEGAQFSCFFSMRASLAITDILALRAKRLIFLKGHPGTKNGT